MCLFRQPKKAQARTGLALISQYYCSDNESRKLSGLLRLVAVNVRRSFPYDAKTDHDDQQAAQQASQHHRDSKVRRESQRESEEIPDGISGNHCVGYIEHNTVFVHDIQIEKCRYIVCG